MRKKVEMQQPLERLQAATAEHVQRSDVIETYVNLTIKTKH